MALRREGWLWGTVLALSIAAGAIGAARWMARGEHAPAPSPLHVEEPLSSSREEGHEQTIVPDLPPVPVLPPELRARPSDVETAPSGDGDEIDRLGEEMRLVQEAQRALDREPARALDLLERHRERFPGGALNEAREACTIEAMIALGRRDAAERRYLEFIVDFPRSSFRERLERRLRRER